jgi:hypothetical protein
MRFIHAKEVTNDKDRYAYAIRILINKISCLLQDILFKWAIELFNTTCDCLLFLLIDCSYKHSFMHYLDNLITFCSAFLLPWISSNM